MSAGDQEPFTDYSSLFRLDGKVFLIAGASGGIGAASARALSHLGARVLCVGRDHDRAAAIAKAVGGIPATGDVTEEADVVRLLDLAESEFGRLDGIVDVVGGARFLSIRELDVETWDRQFSLNLRQTFFLGRHAGMRLADGGGGSLIFVSSIAAAFGSRAYPAYAAAKLGLVSWVRSLAEEFGSAGVRANAVAPAAVVTERLRRAWTEEALADMAAPTVLERLGRVQEIGATVAFLASDASGFITGQTIFADGGASVRDPFYGGGRNRGEADIRRDQKERIAKGLPWP